MTDRARVAKIGGSLLSRADAARAIGRWLDARRQTDPRSHQLLIVGGGEPVEWLRRLDRGHPIGERAAHWAAIRMMDANTQAVAGWFDDARLADDWAAVCRRLERPGATLFQTEPFLRTIEPDLPGTTLPVGWRVTSDSIAGRVAQVLGAPLTLLKSAPLSDEDREPPDWRQLAEQGIVDPYFPEIANQLGAVRIESL